VIHLSQPVSGKLITFMDLVEIEIKHLCILEKITMRWSLLQQLSELFKILLPKNKDSSVVSKKIRMLKSINRTGHIIKMMSLVLILLEERTETLSLQENVERCLLFTSGIQTLCLLLLPSILELLPKV
jgi:hypothetical protein